MRHLQKKEKGRREWVKNAALVFLAVMLVLTFFSKTIMNASLTEVSGQYIRSGTITTGVTGSGVVTANAAYHVQLDEQRTVSEVLVSAGDEVAAGDVLFRLEPIENTALSEAEQTLADMQYDYSVKLLENADASYAVENQNIQNLRDQLSEATTARANASGYKTALDAAKTALDSAQSKVTSRQSGILSLKEQIAAATADDAELAALKSALTAAQSEQSAAASAYAAAQETTGAAQSAMAMSLSDAASVVTAASRAVEEAELELGYRQADYDALAADASAETDAVTEALRAVERQEQELSYLREDLSAAQESYNALVPLDAALTAAQNAEESARQILAEKDAATALAQEAVDARTDALTGALSERLSSEESTLALEQEALSQAQAAYARAQEEYSANAGAADISGLRQSLELALVQLSEQQRADGVAAQVADLSLERDKAAIEEQQALVDALREKGVQLEVAAPYDGTVAEVSALAGDIIAPGQTMATVNVAGREYTLAVTVSAEQAKLVSPGDTASVTNGVWGEIDARLAAIKDDPDAPGKNKILEFDVSGDVADGQSLSVLIGERSTSYDMVVPKSAVHEDANGPFVLVAASKSTPLGSRYVAERMAVVVTASDSVSAAIETGSAYSYEYVITTSSAPIAAGETVRLANG